MRNFWRYTVLRWNWATKGVWGKVETIGAIAGIVVAGLGFLCADWMEQHGGNSVTTFWLAVIPLAAGFSFIAIRWLFSSFAVYRNLESKVADDLRQEREASQRLKNEVKLAVADARSKGAEIKRLTLEGDTAEKARLEKVAQEYEIRYKKENHPNEYTRRMKLLLESGLFSLDEIPNFLSRLVAAIISKGIPSPLNHQINGVEYPYWEQDRLLPFLKWAVTVSLFQHADNECAFMAEYYTHASSEPDVPVFPQQQTNQPSSMAVASPFFEEQPETPAAAPPQA